MKARLQPYNHVCIKEYDAEQRARDVALTVYLNAYSPTVQVNGGLDQPQEASVNSGIRNGQATGPNGANGMEMDSTAPPYPSAADVIDQPTDEAIDNLRKRKNRSNSQQEGLDDNEDCKPESSIPQGLSKSQKKKQKKKQKRKETEQQQPVPQERMDETLLAVIGVLDTAKTQSNIAGWIRAGGLWLGKRSGHSVTAHPHAESLMRSPNDGQADPSGGVTSEELATLPVSSPQATVVAEFESDEKHRASASQDLDSGAGPGVDNHATAGNDAGTAQAASSSPATHSSLAPHSSLTEESQSPAAMSLGETQKRILETNESETNSSSPVSEPMWFQDESNVQYWVDKGRQALKSLGIEEVHGIRT